MYMTSISSSNYVLATDYERTLIITFTILFCWLGWYQLFLQIMMFHLPNNKNTWSHSCLNESQLWRCI